MKMKYRQQGISFLFMLVLIGLFGYAIYIGIKLVPAYLEFHSIKSSIDGVAAELKTRNMNKKQAQDLLVRRLNTNYVNLRDLKPNTTGCSASKKDAFHFKRTKSNIEIGINYEKRIPMVANVDAVLDFNYLNLVPLPE